MQKSHLASHGNHKRCVKMKEKPTNNKTYRCPLAVSVKKQDVHNNLKIIIMIPYSSTSGKISGITAYEIGKDYIIVQFDIVKYRYSYSSCGRSITEEMKELALISCGLSTFISRVQPAYDWKR